MAKTQDLIPVCAHCGNPVQIRLVPKAQAEAPQRPPEEFRG